MTKAPVSVSFELRPDDFKAWWLFLSESRPVTRHTYVFGGLALGFLAMVVANYYRVRLEAVLLVGCAGGAGGYFGLRRLTRGGVMATAADLLKTKAAATQFGSHKLVIDERGISEEAPNATHSHTWAAVDGLCETPDHFFLVVAASSAYIIPKRAFSGDTAAQAFWSSAHSLRVVT